MARTQKTLSDSVYNPLHASDISLAKQGNTRMAQEQIARRAYELFLARGGEHGHDVEDWLQAERELSLGRYH